MVELVLDVRHGATAEALLGALVEAGASLEAVDAAVAALGRGHVPLQVHATAAGSSLRIRAPQGAPIHETWDVLRTRLAYLALDPDVVATALAILDALYAARGTVDGIPAGEVEADPFSGPDDLANALALAAATRNLAVDRVVTTAVGHGTGTLGTLEGDVELPGPVVAAVLADLPVIRLEHAREVVDPIAAAYLAAVPDEHGRSLDDVPAADVPGGRGRIDARASIAALLLTHPTSQAV